MINILKVDFYKMFKAKSFYVIGFILTALAAINSYFYAKMALDSFNAMGSFSANMAHTFTFFDTLYTMVNSFNIYISIFVVLFMCSEFSNGTIKNIATKGYHRESIYLSKFVTSVAGSIIYVLCVALATYIPYFVVFANKSSYDVFNMPENFIPRFSLMFFYIIVYISISLMIASLLRKSGISIFGVFALSLIDTLVVLFDMFLKNVIETDFKLSKYTLYDNLMILGNNLHKAIPSEDFLRIILVPVSFLVVSMAIGLVFFKKRDM